MPILKNNTWLLLVLVLIHAFVWWLGSVRCFYSGTPMVSGEETFEGFFVQISGISVGIVGTTMGVFASLFPFVFSIWLSPIKTVSYVMTGNFQGKCPKRVRGMLQDFLPSPRSPRHHFHYTFSIQSATKDFPKLKKKRSTIHLSRGEITKYLCHTESILPTVFPIFNIWWLQRTLDRLHCFSHTFYFESTK